MKPLSRMPGRGCAAETRRPHPPRGQRRSPTAPGRGKAPGERHPMLPRFPRDGRLALLGVLVLLLAARPAAAGSLGVLVPAYFYPSFLGSDWDRMDTAAGKIPLTAIMNPASGPGPSQNSD